MPLMPGTDKGQAHRSREGTRPSKGLSRTFRDKARGVPDPVSSTVTRVGRPDRLLGGGLGRKRESSHHPHANDGSREVTDVPISSREVPPPPSQ